MKRVFGIGLFLSLVLVLTGCGPTVPDFRSMTSSQAQKAIQAAGLKVGELSYDVEAGASTGTVVAQKPDVGTRVAAGSSVALTLAGPRPVAAPSLGGLDTTAAAATLAAAGLKLGAVVETYSATVPAGTLISQSPVPGEDTPKGSTISLVVSKGPSPATVPSVKGLSQAAASKILMGAGFKVVASRKASIATSGTVLSQSPAGGKAQPGTSVQITVSTGVASPQADLLGAWKASDGRTYTFRPGNRVATPNGGVARYRLAGSTLQVFSAGSPLLGTISWISSNQFTLTVKGKAVTYKRV